MMIGAANNLVTWLEHALETKNWLSILQAKKINFQGNLLVKTQASDHMYIFEIKSCLRI